MSKFSLLVAASLLAAAPALAEVPHVVTDIAPVHSLTAQVMKGVGEPVLLVAPGQSPHSYALRPSQAKALEQAGLVVWVGHPLTPWLEKPLEALAAKADKLELIEGKGTIERHYRGAADIMAEADHDHAAEAGHDHDHAEVAADDDGHHHDHNGPDPHAWLDPENGKVWLGLIADKLAALDPEHAEIYRANAAAGQARIDAVEQDILAKVEPMAGVPFVSYHDAFQYFELRYGLALVGRVTASDAADPSPAHLAQLRDRLERSRGCAAPLPSRSSTLVC